MTPTHYRSFRTETWASLPPRIVWPKDLHKNPVSRSHVFLDTGNGHLFVQALRYDNGAVWTPNMGWINKGGAG